MSRVILAVLILSYAATPAKSALLGVDITDSPQRGGIAEATSGYAFTLTQSYTLVSLGVWDEDANGLSESHEVGIWNSDGSTLLASTTVPSGTGGTLVSSAFGAGGWRFSSIAELTLAPGDYVIGAHYIDADFMRSQATVSSLPGITVDTGAARYSNRSGSLAFPTETDSSLAPGLFGPGFQVQEVQAIPEPGSIALLSIVMGTLGGTRLLRQRKFA